MAHTLWCLGYPEQALHKSHEAVTLAQKLSHPFSLTVAQAYAAMLSQFRRQKQATRKRAEATVALCERHRFAYYLAWGTIIKGWVGAENGEAEDGMAEMQQGISALRATGSSLRLPYYRALLTAAFRETGNVAEGLRVLDEAFADVQQTGERWVEAELYRLKGELLLQYPSDNFAEVETCFQKPSTLPASSKPNLGNFALLIAWPAYGSPRTSAKKPTPTFPIWLNIPLSKSSAFFKPLSICETLAVGLAIITP